MGKLSGQVGQWGGLVVVVVVVEGGQTKEWLSLYLTRDILPDFSSPDQR